MGIDYFVFYAEGNIICIMILLIILINDRLHNTMQEKQICFNRTLLAHILYFSSDIVWAAIIGGQLPKIRLLIALINLSNYILMSLVAYEWFMFMAVSEKMTIWTNRRMKWKCSLPMIVSTVIMMIAYAVKPYYWISEAGELNSMYYPLQIAAPALYLIIALVISMKNAKQAKTKEDRDTYRLIGIYPIAVFLFGIVQVVFVNAPTFCFGVTVMLLFFYIQNMQMRISVDALTGLNNQGQIIRHMEQVTYQENTRIIIMMLDLDHFKEINDDYGHAEGDRALILVSQALKHICEQFKTPVFLGRYGGDEFAIIYQISEGGNDPKHLTEEIRVALADVCQHDKLPYTLETSVGYSELKDAQDTMQKCMIRADESLYADKRNRTDRN